MEITSPGWKSVASEIASIVRPEYLDEEGKLYREADWLYDYQSAVDGELGSFEIGGMMTKTGNPVCISI